MIIDPQNPIYNSLIFYIIIMCMILLLKPKIMYCHKKNKFKSFGLGKHNTLLSFPVVTIFIAIVLYMIFIMINIMFNCLKNK